MLQVTKVLEEEKKRLKKQQEKQATKQKIILDSQQAKLLDLEPESSVSSPPVISQATILKTMVGEEALEDSEHQDEKSQTLKSLNTNKY